MEMTAARKRTLIWSVFGILVVVGVVYAFAPRPIRVDVTTISSEPMIVTVAEEGETRIHDVFVLSAPVAGRLQRIDVHVGDPVVAEQTVLARIEPGDPSLLDPRSEAQAKAAILTAESARRLALAGVEEAQAELDFAETEFHRVNRLVAEATLPERALDEVGRALKIKRAGLSTARAALQMRLYELEQAKARLIAPSSERVAVTDCECPPITAPVDGLVLQVPNRSERVVAVGESLVEIGDPRDLEIVVDFLSADAVRMAAGQRVLIENWGGETTLEGHVRRVEPFGFTKVSALGIEEQRVNVVIDLDSPPESWTELGHGYQVLARVVLWESPAALTVPLTAVFRVEKSWMVFLVQGRRARLTPVKLGQRDGLVAQVLDGLSDGDRVVLHPSNRVLDGARVTPRGA